jgi:flagellar assembly protein FliH
MSTLYDDTTHPVVPLVEAFRYNDTSGPQSAQDRVVLHAGEPAQSTNAVPLKGAFITEESVPRRISEAHAKGVTQGARQAATHFEAELGRERKQVADLVAQFQRQRADYYAKVEIELVHFALAIAAKILHRESQVDPMVVAGLVKVMLEKLQQKSKVAVRVRPEVADAWSHYFRDLEKVQIVPDATLAPNACLLETELGVADMALESQLKEVEKGFFDLLAQRPEPK